MPKKTVNPSQSLKIPKLILLSSKYITYISPKKATFFAAKLFIFPKKIKI